MGSLFKSPPKPKIPELPKPTPMVDEDRLSSSARKAAAKLRQRGGRQSTILSDTDKLGG